MSPLCWVPHSLFDIQISFTSQHKPRVSCYSHPQGSIYPFLYDKGPHSQSYGFPSSHVQIWELDHKEGWVQKNWCFRTTGLEKTVEPPHCWGFSPRDLEAMNLKEGHLDSLWQGLTSLFLQSIFFIEAGTKSLKYTVSRVHTELTHNQ